MWTALQYSPQRRVLDVRWYDLVHNTIIAERTGHKSLISSLCRSHLAIFGLVHQLPETTPAHTVPRLAVNTHPDHTRTRRRNTDNV